VLLWYIIHGGMCRDTRLRVALCYCPRVYMQCTMLCDCVLCLVVLHRVVLLYGMTCHGSVWYADVRRVALCCVAGWHERVHGVVV